MTTAQEAETREAVDEALANVDRELLTPEDRQVFLSAMGGRSLGISPVFYAGSIERLTANAENSASQYAGR